MAKEKLRDDAYIRYKLSDQKKSTVEKYRALTVGDKSWLTLFKYEIMTTLLSPIPGGIGLFLRGLVYRRLLPNASRGIFWGRSITLRHYNNIFFGRRVVVDDYALIDARGALEEGIKIGDETIIGRGVIIQAKVGPIHIGKEVNIGAGSVISSQGGIYIDDYVNIAGNCHLAGGTYDVGREHGSVREHGKYTTGPIHLKSKSRLGRGAMVLDGSCIGEGTIVGAMSMAKGDLPDYCVAAGIPARVLYSRNEVDKNEK
jgi:acetyltransferase-like isoleucine patch superfamily enzyme